MLGKNGLHIRIQLVKSYQNDKLLFLGFGKVLKMQGSVIITYTELIQKQFAKLSNEINSSLLSYMRFLNTLCPVINKL